jgi:hypothetical protein
MGFSKDGTRRSGREAPWYFRYCRVTRAGSLPRQSNCPLRAQPCPSQRMPWTAGPPAFDNKAASIPASPASLRP